MLRQEEKAATQRAGGTAAQIGIQGPLSGAVRYMKSAWLSASSPLSPPCCFCMLAALKHHINVQDKVLSGDYCSPRDQHISSCQDEPFAPLFFLLNIQD